VHLKLMPCSEHLLDFLLFELRVPDHLQGNTHKYIARVPVLPPAVERGRGGGAGAAKDWKSQYRRKPLHKNTEV